MKKRKLWVTVLIIGGVQLPLWVSGWPLEHKAIGEPLLDVLVRWTAQDYPGGRGVRRTNLSLGEKGSFRVLSLPCAPHSSDSHLRMGDKKLGSEGEDLPYLVPLYIADSVGLITSSLHLIDFTPTDDED
ncbi:hypothetical protein CJ030_MR4G023059 [Morella rubra]|uniref:Uncharacterized protein n=1 Tax=Morella rubra TaxID=262757 RepID=A0A6A1VY88_9ROSI|nr:hypothetical protein CJ030_MR4G023059 [Morella rubra]